MTHGGQDGATDQNLASSIALALRPTCASEQSILRRSQSRHPFIDGLNARVDSFVLSHEVTSIFADALQSQCQDARGRSAAADSKAAARVAHRLQDGENRPKAHFGVSPKRARVRLWPAGVDLMEMFDPSRELRGGGHARQSGGCYHLSFRSGSRGRGSCASAACDYITRTDEYDDPDRDPAIYTESDHMPAWAKDDAHEYWDSADLFERANGRLYVAADFALPRDLDPDDQIELARAFAQEITAKNQLPYTLAIHAGRDQDGHEHNPHVHLMISERQNDGVERDRQQWFKRADRAHPERGGAPKTRELHGREWVEHARERWAELTNDMLERSGRNERVDHRSYERQGIDREPGQHYGPAAAHMTKDGIDHERLRDAADAADAAQRLEQIDRALAAIEAGAGRTSEDDPDRRPSLGGFGSYSRDDDRSPGR